MTLYGECHSKILGIGSIWAIHGDPQITIYVMRGLILACTSVTYIRVLPFSYWAEATTIIVYIGCRPHLFKNMNLTQDVDRDLTGGCQL